MAITGARFATSVGPRRRVAGLVAMLAIAIVVIALGARAFEAIASTDDFCNRLLATDQPLRDGVVASYRDWTGRVVTTTLLYAAMATFGLDALVPVALALVALFVSAGIGIGALADPGGLRWPASAFALSATTIALYPVLGQTLFWITGGVVYTVPLALLVAWLVSMRRVVVDGRRGSGAVGGFVLGVVVGNAIEFVAPIALAYTAGAWWPRRHRLAAGAGRIVAARVLGIAAGAAILVLAPGNMRRASATPGSFSRDPAYLFDQLVAMLATLLDVAWPAVAIAVAIAFAGAMAARPGSIIETRAPPLDALAVALGGLAGLLPLLAVPAQFTPRNLLFVVVAALIAALLWAMPRIARRRGAALALSALALVGAIGSASAIVDDLGPARAIRARLETQHRDIESAARAGMRDVVAPPIALVPPPTMHFIELSTDASRWDNKCVARYYGVDSIRVSPAPR